MLKLYVVVLGGLGRCCAVRPDAPSCYRFAASTAGTSTLTKRNKRA